MPMSFVQPLEGQSFEVGEMIHFAGTSPAGTSRVTLKADGRYSLMGATLSPSQLPNGQYNWFSNQRLLGQGNRVITATSIGTDEQVIAEVSVDIRVGTPHIGNYVPPLSSLDRLGDIVRHLEDNQSERITRSFQGKRALFKLPGGQIYMDSKLDLDTDGSVYSEGQDHRDDTSLHQKNGRPLDANAVPYFVLPNPEHSEPRPGGDLFKGLGITWGDIAAIIHGGYISFALFGDGGPQAKVGEASIQVHRELGIELLRPSGSIINSGIDEKVVTIIFPRLRE